MITGENFIPMLRKNFHPINPNLLESRQESQFTLTLTMLTAWSLDAQ
jgi:hypothetical protein